MLIKFGLNNIKIRLVPYFNETKLDLVLGYIINIRLGHIIVTGIRMLLHSIKGGDNIGRTSYRKYNETHYGNIKEMIGVNTIVGDAVETSEGTVIIPVSRVSFGFVAGGESMGKIFRWIKAIGYQNP